jgi:hypothetical protein
VRLAIPVISSAWRFCAPVARHFSDRIHKTFIFASSSRNNSLLFIFRAAISTIRLPISAEGAAVDAHVSSDIASDRLICLGFLMERFGPGAIAYRQRFR